MDTRVVSEALSKTLLYWFYSFGITHKKKEMFGAS